jgi:hypothetical protein
VINSFASTLPASVYAEPSNQTFLNSFELPSISSSADKQSFSIVIANAKGKLVTV